MKNLRWFLARNLVRLANKLVPTNDCQYVMEVTFVDSDIERQVCDKIKEKLRSLKTMDHMNLREQQERKLCSLANLLQHNH